MEQRVDGEGRTLPDRVLFRERQVTIITFVDTMNFDILKSHVFSFRSTACLQYPSDTVAVAVIRMALKHKGIEIVKCQALREKEETEALAKGLPLPVHRPWFEVPPLCPPSSLMFSSTSFFLSFLLILLSSLPLLFLSLLLFFSSHLLFMF